MGKGKGLAENVRILPYVGWGLKLFKIRHIFKLSIVTTSVIIKSHYAYDNFSGSMGKIDILNNRPTVNVGLLYILTYSSHTYQPTSLILTGSKQSNNVDWL